MAADWLVLPGRIDHLEEMGDCSEHYSMRTAFMGPIFRPAAQLEFKGDFSALLYTTAGPALQAAYRLVAPLVIRFYFGRSTGIRLSFRD